MVLCVGLVSGNFEEVFFMKKKDLGKANVGERKDNQFIIRMSECELEDYQWNYFDENSGGASETEKEERISAGFDSTMDHHYHESAEIKKRLSEEKLALKKEFQSISGKDSFRKQKFRDWTNRSIALIYRHFSMNSKLMEQTSAMIDKHKNKLKKPTSQLNWTQKNFIDLIDIVWHRVGDRGKLTVLQSLITYYDNFDQRHEVALPHRARKEREKKFQSEKFKYYSYTLRQFVCKNM